MNKKSSKKKMPPPKATLLLLGMKTKMPKRQKADEIQLVPFDGFKTAVKKVRQPAKRNRTGNWLNFRQAGRRSSN